MIISVKDAKLLIDLKDWSDEKIERKLKAIEQIVRAYTNNNFQLRASRSVCYIESHQVFGHIPGLSPGDTVQISESRCSNGLYTVKDVNDHIVSLNEEVYDEPHALITKIRYPDDVIDCCMNLLEWEVKLRDKVGIKSETLSRHSVTYYDQDANNQVMGYPVSILGSLRPYRKIWC